jgi:exodeoxyribonuclease VII small subunit
MRAWKPKDRMAENKSGSFEASLDRLSAIVRELEGPSVDLERSVALFKEGRTLVERCEELLKAAEGTLRAADGTATVPPPGADGEPVDEQPF